MIADHKAGESGERHGSHSGGLKAGSHIDETVLSSIKSGEFPDASPYESCSGAGHELTRYISMFVIVSRRLLNLHSQDFMRAFS